MEWFAVWGSQGFYALDAEELPSAGERGDRVMGPFEDYDIAMAIARAMASMEPA